MITAVAQYRMFMERLIHSLRYKKYTLSVLANWQIGGLTYDDTYAAYMHAGTYGASLHTDMLKRWKKPGDITNVPRMDNAQTSFLELQVLDF